MKVSLITLKHKGLAYCAGFDGPAALQDTSIDKMRSQSLAVKSAKTQRDAVFDRPDAAF